MSRLRSNSIELKSQWNQNQKSRYNLDSQRATYTPWEPEDVLEKISRKSLFFRICLVFFLRFYKIFARFSLISGVCSGARMKINSGLLAVNYAGGWGSNTFHRSSAEITLASVNSQPFDRRLRLKKLHERLKEEKRDVQNSIFIFQLFARLVNIWFDLKAFS